MKISVIIPAYNVEKFIERSINSALNQTFKPFEIIVVDDGSTDNTAEIVKKYNDKVRCIYQTNQGSSSARNHGIIEAKGDWIAFLDSDDEWIETHLENFVDTYKLYPEIKWYGAPFKMLDEKSKIEVFKVNRRHLRGKDKHTMFHDYLYALPPKAYFSSPTMVIHKSVFSDNAIGYFDISKKTAVDIDMWFRIGLKFPRIGYTYEEAAIVYKRDLSLSTSKKWQPEKAINRFLECQNRAKKLGCENRAKKRISYWAKSLFKVAIQKKDTNTMKEIYKYFQTTFSFKDKIVIKITLSFLPLIYLVFNREE